MQRVVDAAQDSFESVMTALAGFITGETNAVPEEERDPCVLYTLSQQVAFTIGVIGLGAKMAKADGVVTPEEEFAFREVFHIPAGEERNVARVFNLARQDVAGFESYAEQIAGLLSGCPAVLEDLLDGLFHIAKADGTVDDSEVAFLATVARIFGFSDAEFERIRCTHMGCPNADPYAVLGVESSVSDADLKRAYHALVRENHPDALVARGVPEEFVLMANAKLALITTAYETVRRQRASRPVLA